ncbi:amidohydrolase family protein [Propylenella binzhouense]|uniref:amidohydrolase family protein n=1 Tax=Propylenella binzhouense TaxID=2555902 RepID=UPI001371E59F|nr:amidohydrolase family protein [Propylenella binzhouense]
MSQPSPERPGESAPRQQSRHPRIDAHCHIVIPEVLEMTRAVKLRGSGPGKRDWIPEESRRAHREQADQTEEKLLHPEARLPDMDAMGIDIQVVSMNLPTPAYWAAAAVGQRIARACNEGVAAFVRRRPDRFLGIGVVPLQDVRLALRELDHIAGLDLRGVQIPSNVRNREVGEAAFRPFWARAAELGLPVIIHPRGFTHDDRLHKFFLWNTIGQPLEEALAMASLIHEGVLDAYPDLRVVMSHGGGYLPYYSGRGDRAFHSRPEPKRNIAKPPSAYFPRFYYDSVVFDPDMMPRLIRQAGADRIVMGTDYPRGEVEEDPVGFIGGLAGVSAADKLRMMSTNAQALFGLPAQAGGPGGLPDQER